MAERKFDETDRSAVVRNVERTLGVTLSRVGRRRKWYSDEAGKSFWIIGGYGEWHGVTEEMMDAEVSNTDE